MVRVKDMNIVANAQANFEFNNAKKMSSTPNTALRLYTSAGNSCYSIFTK